MNKFFIRMVALAMSMVIALSMVGCKKTEPEIDAQEILKALLTNVNYDSELSQVGHNAELYFPDLPQNTTIQLYTGSGYFVAHLAENTMLLVKVPLCFKFSLLTWSVR